MSSLATVVPPSKSKLSNVARPLPVVPIGQPWPPPAPAMSPNGIPEPASVVGDLTGKVYDNIGDNPQGPETLQVTPPGGQQQNVPVGPPGGQGEGFWDMVSRLHAGAGGRASPMVSPPTATPGAQSFANGTDEPQQVGQITPPRFAGEGGLLPGASSTQITPPPFAGEGGLQPNAGGGPSGPSTAIYNQQDSVYNQQQRANQAGQDANQVAQGALVGRAGVIAATADSFGASSAYTAAQRSANDAAGRQNQQNRAYITQQGADVAARTDEEQKLQASAANVSDLAAVAQAQGYRTDKEAEDQRFDGVSAPQQIVVPPGYTGQLPAGVEAKYQTQNEQQQTQFSNADKLRSLSLDAAKNIVDLAGTDAAAASIAAKAAGFTVDEAKQKIAEASNLSSAMQLNVDQANLKTNAESLKATGAQISLSQLKNLPPGTAVWEDPNTGESSIVPQAVADANKLQYENQLAIDNAPNAASSNAATTLAHNAAQNVLEQGYLQNPGAQSTPTSWIVANTTRTRTTVTGAVYTNPGLLTRRQAIDALMDHGWSSKMAFDATAPDTSASGTGGITGGTSSRDPATAGKP